MKISSIISARTTRVLKLSAIGLVAALGSSSLAVAKTPVCTFAPDKALGVPAITRGISDVFFSLDDDFREPTPLNHETAVFLQWLNDVLAQRRTKLIVLWSPSRGYSLSEFLDLNDAVQRVYSSDEVRKSSDDLVDRLRDLGLTVVDLTDLGEPSKETPFFLLREPYWTSDASRMAAQEIASAITRDPTYEDLAKTELAPRPIGSGLAQSPMLTEIRRACRQPFEQEVQPRYVFEPIATSRLAQVAPVGPASVLLTGSSNVADAVSDLAGFLRQYTQLSVQNDATLAADPFASLLNAVSARSFRESPPRYLIWELPASTDINNRAAGLMRQIIPAADGKCEQTLAATQNRLITDLHPVLSKDDFGGGPLKAANAYLELSVQGDNRGSIDLTIDYDNGELDIVSLGETSKVTAGSTFYGWFSPEINAGLDSIALRNLPSEGLVVSARICALTWPDGQQS